MFGGSIVGHHPNTMSQPMSMDLISHYSRSGASAWYIHVQILPVCVARRALKDEGCALSSAEAVAVVWSEISKSMQQEGGNIFSKRQITKPDKGIYAKGAVAVPDFKMITAPCYPRCHTF